MKGVTLLYGEDKVRHLACNTKTKTRFYPEAKKSCNRSHRKRIKNQLRKVLKDSETFYDNSSLLEVPRDRRYIRGNISSINSNPIDRWSLHHSKEASPQRKVGQLKAKLPATDAGRRSAAMIPTWRDEFRWQDHDDAVQRMRRGPSDYEQRMQVLLDKLAEELYHSISEGSHKQLNQLLRRAGLPNPTRWKFFEPLGPSQLLGAHDITRFVRQFGKIITNPCDFEQRNFPEIQPIRTLLNLTN